MDGLCGKAMTCNSMTQVKKYITSLERCVLKAPWSGSGRGIMYVSSKEWNDSAEGMGVACVAGAGRNYGRTFI